VLIAKIIGGIAIVASLIFVGVQMQVMTYQNLTYNIINFNRE
jgi:hypothetical protein